MEEENIDLIEAITTPSTLSSDESSDEEITQPKYKLPKLETIELDKNKINNMLDKNEMYYIIYSDTCPMCIILLKYLKHIKFNYKLVHARDLTQMDSKLNTIAVPYVLNSKKQRVNIHSLLEILREHNIKSLK